MHATLISAPTSTKNASGQRDPVMCPIKQGAQRYLRLKVRIGADADPGVVHPVRGTSTNVNDVVEAHRLLHGDERDVFDDAAKR